GLGTLALVVLTLRRARQGALAVALAGSSTLILGAAFWAGRVKHVTDHLPFGAVALVALGYAGFAWAISRTRETDGKLAVAALMVVLFQGLLGGLTVLYRLPTLVIVMHLGTSMLFLCLAVVLAVRAGGTPLNGVPQIAPRGLLWLTAAAVYLQILLGATVRHTGAGLVCVDLPFCRGALWPAGVHPMVHLHMADRAFAFVVLGLVCWSSLRVARCSCGLVRGLAWSAPALVVIQIALGILTIVTFKDLVPVTAHQPPAARSPDRPLGRPQVRRRPGGRLRAAAHFRSGRAAWAARLDRPGQLPPSQHADEAPDGDVAPGGPAPHHDPPLDQLDG